MTKLNKLQSFIEYCRQRGIYFWRQGQNLKCHITKSCTLTSEQRSFIKRHKTELLDMVPTYGDSEKVVLTILPLMALQQGILFHSIVDTDANNYFVQAHWTYRQPIDSSLLKTAWTRCFKQYDVLRVAFNWDTAEQLVQIIYDSVNVPWQEVDLLHKTAEHSNVLIEDFMERDRQRGFRLDQPSPVRLCLFKVDKSTSVFVFSFHHILLDGWSVSLLLEYIHQEYWCLYNSQKKAQLSAPSMADYVNWIQMHQVIDEAFWTNYLKKFDGATIIPGQTRPLELKSVTKTVAVYTLNSSGQLSDKLAKFCQQHGFTVNAVIQLAWIRCLIAASCQTTISYGLVVSGRANAYANVDRVVGLLINTLPLIYELKPGQTVLNHLHLLQSIINDLNTNSDIGLRDLKEIAQCINEPLFNVIVAFENYPIAKVNEVNQLQISNYQVYEQNNYPLSLTVALINNEVRIKANYDSKAYKSAVIEQLVTRWILCIRKIIQYPEVDLTSLDLLTDHERFAMLDKYQSHPVSPAIHTIDLFLAQVKRDPTALAVMDPHEELTYAQLDQKSNALAFRLQTRHDVVQGDLIAIRMMRSCNLIVALLGVIKVRAAFLLLDGTQPEIHLKKLTGHAQAKLVLTEKHFEGFRDYGFSWQNDESANDLAYVIYTSGSTGKPKAVMISQSAISHHVTWFQSHYRTFQGKKILCRTSIAFDVALHEIFCGLASGMALVMCDETIMRDGLLLIRQIMDDQVSILHVVPSLLRVMLAYDEFQMCDSLERVYCAGEVLDASLIEKFYQVLPAATLWNAYGPTEATIYTTLQHCNPRNIKAEVVPIGKPIVGANCYVLDPYKQLQPPSFLGELHISGPGCAVGYLRMSDQTQQKFITNPHHDDISVMYATGDMVGYDPDGLLFYHDRYDQQIKIRGYRVELEEVRQLLMQHPGVSDAKVILNQRDSHKQLIAYYIVESGCKTTINDLIQFCEQHMLSYMRPTEFIIVDNWPRQLSGKIDVKRLPLIAFESSNEATSSIQSTNLIEQKLLTIWQATLNKKSVTIYDDFFACGGDSISAILLVARARKQKIYFSVADVFKWSTIHQLAQRVDINSRLVEESVYPVRVAPERLRALAKYWPDIIDAYPLAPLQRGLLFHYQFDHSDHTYVQQITLCIAGSINAIAFEKACAAVVDHYDIFRTVFYWIEDQEPLQCVLRQGIVDLEVCNSLDEQQLRQDRQHGFDLTKLPLIRFKLALSTDDVQRLVISFHHIICDGWSFSQVIKTLGQAYQRALHNQNPLVTKVPVPFVHFINLVSQKGFDQAFWQDYLTDHRIPTRCITDFNPERRILRTTEQCYHRMDLGNELTERIQNYAAHLKITVNCLFQCLWGMVLSIYANSSDAVFGVTVSGRPTDLENVEQLVGMLINTIPVRIICPSDSIAAWLLNQQQQWLNLSEQSHTPLTKIKEFIDYPSEQLFDSLLVFENLPLSEGSENWGNQCSLSLETVFSQTEYPLELNVTNNQTLKLNLLYNPALYLSDTAANILRRLCFLLKRIVQLDCNANVSDLYQLPPIEQKKLLNWSNGPFISFTAQPSILQQFYYQVRQYPEREAVVDGERRFTYATLHALSNHIANQLQANSVGRGELVALCLDRSVEFLIGMLAILKVGGVFVPMDSGYPAERIDYMLSDSGARIVLTDSKVRSCHSSIMQRQFLDLDILCRQSIGPLKQDFDAIVADPNDWAYVMYTSGSTGSPKGAITHHAGAWNHILAEIEALQLWNGFNFLQSAAASSDISVWQFLAPLMVGGKIVIIKDMTDMPLLHHLVIDEAITLVELVPVVLNLWLDHIVAAALDPRAIKALKWVMAVGEAVPIALVNRWLSLFPTIPLVDAYGPTEASDDVCQAVIDKPLTASLTTVPIGQPIANMSVMVLDKQQRLSPIGVIGEICISGVGVGPGYWKQSHKTEASFVENPHATHTFGKRLYKTGDLGRWRANGALEFLGRVDNQVQINGFRVEIGEIESVIGQHVAIKATVVMTREVCEDKKLVAYYLLHKVEQIKPDDIRRYLERRLPRHMVPSLYVELESFPVGPSGKIARDQLPNPVYAEYQDNSSLEFNQIEQKLSAFWCEVLNVKCINRQDNFFLLGGHSLLATRLLTRVRTYFSVKMILQDIFDYPTLADQAQWIEQHLNENKTDTLQIPIVDRSQLQPLSYAQQRLWFLHQYETGLHSTNRYHIPLALSLHGELDQKRLKQALQYLLNRHEIFRTQFIERDGKPYQKILSECPIAWVEETVHDSLQKRIREVCKVPFSLEKIPLIRFYCFKQGPIDHTLVIVQHHIISDAWSLNVFIEELSIGYHQLYEGKSIELAPLSHQYVDFAVWQRQSLQGEQLTRLLEYWKKYLADISPLELPTDFVRPLRLSYQGGQIRFDLRESLYQRLNQLADGYKTTLFTILYSVFGILMSRLSGQCDLVVGVPVANRNHPLTEKMIGFFINTLPVRFNESNQSTVASLIHAMRINLLSVYDHQDLPFDKLVSDLAVTRSERHHPIFQVMFNLQNAYESIAVNLPRLQVDEVELDIITTKCDLTVGLWTQGSNTLAGCFEYNASLFKRETVTRWLEYYLYLLEQTVLNPHQSVMQLSIMPVSEYHQITKVYNNTVNHAWRSKNLPDAFAESVRCYPDRIAVKYYDQQLNYRQLDERANAVASQVSKLQPGVCVGVLIPPSPNYIIAILGILKAGSAYVPLSLADPVRRLKYIIDDATISVVLTIDQILSTDYRDALTECCDLILMDQTTVLPSFNPTQPILAEHFGYVMYTSGTTGGPKSVPITQGSVANFIKNNRWIKLSERDVFALVSDISFDATTFEIWGALLNGAALVIMDKDTILDHQQFYTNLLKERISVLFQTPRLFDHHIQHRKDIYATLRYLLLGGDVISMSSLTELFTDAKCTPQHVLNGYGPTESTVFVTIHNITTNDLRKNAIPIGRPIDNRQIYVLDVQKRCVPTGVVGELWIGGEGLTPSWDNQSLFPSGDLGYWTDDGVLMFVGRKDHQIKIRGYRVDLNMIQHTLLQCDAIIQALVIPTKQNGRVELVAYYIASTDCKLSGSDYKQQLKQELPHYMVPAHLVLLKTIPLTKNGKLDVQALPKPQTLTATDAIDNDQYRDEYEQQLAAIWCRVLRKSRIGPTDNFFDLGGDSLIAVKIITQIRQTFSINLPIRELFLNPTISEFTKIIKHANSTPMKKVFTLKKPVTPER